MLLILYFVLVSWNFLFIKSEDNIINIHVKKKENCTINYTSNNFTEGQNVTLVIHPDMFINLGWWYLQTATNTVSLYDGIKAALQTANSQQNENKTFAPIQYTRSVDKSMEGTWDFQFYLYVGNSNVRELPRIKHTDGNNYTVSECKMNATIVPVPLTTTTTTPSPLQIKDEKYKNLIIIASVVATVLVIIIIAQAAYIVCLKTKAQKLITLNTHNNLSKRSESIPNDTARYCSNPGQKIMKEPILMEDDNRESVIYEAPNIEIPANPRIPMQPPQPPAITTMPRTPRSDHNMRIGQQTMLSSALNSPARSPVSATLPPNFQRQKQAEREINVANRPKLPLPDEDHPHHDPMFQEVYEQMETEENTYEPPPITNTMPLRIPVPPKKVPTGHLLDVKENTLKSRQGTKPPVVAKPTPQRNNLMTTSEFEEALRRRNENTSPRVNPGHKVHPQQQEQPHRRRPTGDAPTNELEEALRRRNNNGDAPTNELEEALRRRNKVMQVPIVSIPEPSNARNSPKPHNKPKPQLALKPPAKTPHPVQEEIYYNEASSDEEWTYEPLKPLNSYDPNIYNV
ncbi:hypothetical protein PYW08_010955 [Mythimna loreyi]|uniref:Uncharacterized protein n=1 Tax=Mythimna loreyi TaxID=667449 RepID=A0ACC2Q259_9NEOP|nr:hypothetical protein PYW08_010955 [Mythimna loreyi]